MSRMGMGFEMSPRMNLGQHQIIAPKMIQSMEILQLPIMALQEKIQAELQENPFLELKEARAKETETPAVGEFNPDAPIKNDQTGETEFARMDEINRDWGDHFNEEHRPSRAALVEQSDKKLEAMMNIAQAPQTLQDHLAQQLPYLELDPDMLELCEYVISHLDENGYLLGHHPDTGKSLPITLDDLAHGYPDPVTVNEVEEALVIVQDLEPSGVAARDVKECLLNQVDGEIDHPELVAALIQNHLEDVAHNRLPVIQKRTGADLETIHEAIAGLKTLDPKPGARFVSVTPKYVVPDVIVTYTDDGDFAIKLTNDWTPNVRMSTKYNSLVKDKSYDPKTREYLQRKHQSASWLIDAILQRRETLTKVTRAIITHQRGFLDKGPDFIQPLKMEDIAKIVGVHVTTISRAVDDKWVETPRGIFPLKRFFGGGTLNKTTGENVAWETIKQKLVEIIGEENKAKPFSDEEIVEKFKVNGLDVARRTVTKYREALKIPSSRQRKEWAAK